MTTVAKLNYFRKQAGLPLIRFDLTRLREQDIAELREAYAAMYEISEIAPGDNRGYLALARGHGYDQDLCHDDDRVFLTWHRSYVYSFEKALNSALQWKRNDLELELTLPYWDWTKFSTATHAANGLPKVIDEATYVDASGATVENPLARAKSQYRAVGLGLTGDDAYTSRLPSRFRNAISILKDEVDDYLDEDEFYPFQSDFNSGAHGGVHVLVGGRDLASPLPFPTRDMGRTVSAAYDPAFWLHHAMCDKIFADWQAKYPSANIPQHVVDTVVYDGRLGGALIDHETSLRYIYSENSVDSAIGALGTADSAPAMALSAAGSHVTEVSLGLVEAGFKRAELEFHRLRPPKDSFEIRAYIDNPTCSASTGFDDDSYAGRMVLFGHGPCHGAPGHCNPTLAQRDDYDLRAKHPLRHEHTRYRLDISKGLRKFMGRKHTIADLKVYLVTMDEGGEMVASAEVAYDRCSLRTFGKGK